MHNSFLKAPQHFHNALGEATMQLDAWDFKKRAIYTLICMQMAENFMLCLTFLMEYFWTTKGGFFSESAICFSNLQKKIFQKNYPELEI